MVTELLENLDAARVPLAAEIASIPEFIRGYGPVKERHLADAKAREAQLLAQWRDPAGTLPSRGAVMVRSRRGLALSAAGGRRSAASTSPRGWRAFRGRRRAG